MLGLQYGWCRRIGTGGDGIERVGLGGHGPADSRGEFFDLFSEIKEEGVTFPSAQQHDGANIDAGEVEEHGARGT